MPTAFNASHFWPGDGIVAPVTPEPDSPGYQHPYWFDMSVMGSGLHIPLSRTGKKRLKGMWIKLVRRVKPNYARRGVR
jgi:hypothetical protein